MDKRQRRQQSLQWRAALPESVHGHLSDRLCQHLLTFLHQHIPLGATVLAYYPHRQEPDIRSLLAAPDFRWALPRCLPDRQLAWHDWQSGDPLVVGSYGIPEPDPDLPLVMSGSALLIPAVAMDRQGYRLGYGGGYFDRLLANQELGLTVGITFAALLVDRLEIDPWDYPLGAICTESGVLLV
jgi:5-formyltetrahydrofolate cyclo-ligase